MNERFELLKDICYPGRYMRAGAVKTRYEWNTIFPGAVDYEWDEWFISIELIPDPPPQQPNTIVNEVFKKHGLRSMSYNEAAVEACRLYKEHVLEAIAKQQKQ